jgi:hypothetical protein
MTNAKVHATKKNKKTFDIVFLLFVFTTQNRHQLMELRFVPAILLQACILFD